MLGEPDLAGAVLHGADFSESVLCDGSFAGASFQGSRFDGATIADADFRNTDFSGCSLRGAILRGEHLFGLGPVFDGADISGTDFYGTMFRWADFRGARGTPRDIPEPWPYPKDGDSSPWGGIQHVEVLAPGIAMVSTASHGGIWLAPERRKDMPRAPNRAWYEEDGESIRPLAAFKSEIEAYLDRMDRRQLDWDRVRRQAEERHLTWDFAESCHNPEFYREEADAGPEAPAF